MRVSDGWKDYELLDCADGERLERWGNITLIRPDPQVIWQTPKEHPMWRKADARYSRSSAGGGAWQIYKNFPDEWSIKYRDLTFKIKPMGFKHTGLFPEQAVNWDFTREIIEKSGRQVRVLNLFAYTGGATTASLAQNAD
ncbi:MAG: SAM-dependent methyltransferase, partial [Oscillospiraceae bacterium]